MSWVFVWLMIAAFLANDGQLELAIVASAMIIVSALREKK